MCSPTVFISYSSQDFEYSNKICEFLEKNGIKCWMAPRDIRPGASYPNEITRGIKMCDIFLLVITKNSVSSPHVNTETDIAFNSNKIIIPFFADKVELGNSMSYYLARKQWILGYENFSSAKKILLNSLKEQISVKKKTASTISPSIENKDEEKGDKKDIVITKKRFLKVFTKKELVIIGLFFVIFLLFFPPIDLVLLACLWFYPDKIHSLFKNHKKKIIVTLSVIGLLILVFCGLLWYDSYKMAIRESSEVSEEISIIEEVPDSISYNQYYNYPENETTKI